MCSIDQQIFKPQEIDRVFKLVHMISHQLLVISFELGDLLPNIEVPVVSLAWDVFIKLFVELAWVTHGAVVLHEGGEDIERVTYDRHDLVAGEVEWLGVRLHGIVRMYHPNPIVNHVLPPAPLHLLVCRHLQRHVTPRLHPSYLVHVRAHEHASTPREAV